jgi:hypothetical protein
MGRLKITEIKFNKSSWIYFLVILSISLIIFSYYLDKNANYPNKWDQRHYLSIAEKIINEGQFKEPVRTYLYPVIISPFLLLSDGIDYSSSEIDGSIDKDKKYVLSKIIVSFFQYGIYLFTILFIANAAVSKNKDKLIWHSIVTFGFLNPYLIQSGTSFSNNLLPACLIVITIIGLGHWNLRKAKNVSIIIAFLYSASMIRLVYILFIPVFVIIVLFRLIKRKDTSVPKVLIFSVFLLIIFLPQFANNVINYDNWTPFINNDLYSKQSHSAVKYLKYQTLDIEGESPKFRWHSPFPVEKGITIQQLFFKDFFTFVPIYSAHIFVLFDWGYVDNIITEFYPSSRIPASLFLYSSWFFIFWGIFHFIRQKFQNHENNLIYSSLIISATIYTLFVATTSVESRFGYPIFMLLLPFGGYGIKQLYLNCINSNQLKINLLLNRIKIASIFSVFIFVIFYISFILDLQTNKINWFVFLNL